MSSNNEMNEARKAELDGATVKVTNTNSKHVNKVGRVIIVHKKMVTISVKAQEQFRVMHTSVSIVGRANSEDEADFGGQMPHQKKTKRDVTYGRLAHSVVNRLMLGGKYADECITREGWMKMVREVNEEFGWEFGTYATVEKEGPVEEPMIIDTDQETVVSNLF